jgi:hypothetical protein
MMINRTLITTLLAASISFFGASAFAATIYIENAGFEDDAPYEALVNGTDTNPTGWEFYRPAASLGGEYIEIYAPDGTYLPAGPVDLTTGPDQVAAFYLGSDGGSCDTSLNPDGTRKYPDCQEGDGDYPLGLEQDLREELDPGTTVNLEANSKYVLSVEVGNQKSGPADDDFDFSDFGGYRIELLAGDTVIASDDNTILPPTAGEGNFFTATADLTTGSVHDPFGIDLIGMALGIRLIYKGGIEEPDNVTDWYAAIAFDDVSLTVSAVPVPAAVWLFGTALLGLLGFGKRRRPA